MNNKSLADFERIFYLMTKLDYLFFVNPSN